MDLVQPLLTNLCGGPQCGSANAHAGLKVAVQDTLTSAVMCLARGQAIVHLTSHVPAAALCPLYGALSSSACCLSQLFVQQRLGRTSVTGAHQPQQ